MSILNWFLKFIGHGELIRPTIKQKSKDEGAIARDLGIQQAVDNANSKNIGWSDIAYGFLLGYADSHKEFMIEDIRNASVGLVPEPPSNRAWGGIAVRAAKAGIITRKGFQNVKNIKAHKTPATLWTVN